MVGLGLENCHNLSRRGTVLLEVLCPKQNHGDQDRQAS